MRIQNILGLVGQAFSQAFASNKARLINMTKKHKLRKLLRSTGKIYDSFTPQERSLLSASNSRLSEFFAGVERLRASYALSQLLRVAEESQRKARQIRHSLDRIQIRIA